MGWLDPCPGCGHFRTRDPAFADATRDLGHPLNLGWTLAGASFQVEGQDLEKVNDPRKGER